MSLRTISNGIFFLAGLGLSLTSFISSAQINTEVKAQVNSEVNAGVSAEVVHQQQTPQQQ